MSVSRRLPPASALALVGIACGHPAAPAAPAVPTEAAEHPAGTVLAVDGVPIGAEEVRAAAAWIARVEPQYTDEHCERLALSNLVLPRAALRAQRPEARAEALQRAREIRAALRRASISEGGLERVRGNWAELGFDLWGFARELAPGEWSEPFERVGRFVVVRLLERDDAESAPSREELSIELSDVPYVREGTTLQDVDAMIAKSRLSVVDPRWEDRVPESWKYRMRGPR
jgi:hypothetical protein